MNTKLLKELAEELIAKCTIIEQSNATKTLKEEVFITIEKMEDVMTDDVY